MSVALTYDLSRDQAAFVETIAHAELLSRQLRAPARSDRRRIYTCTGLAAMQFHNLRLCPVAAAGGSSRMRKGARAI
jgi:hypothetical protein